jgi:hypothetical protein
MALLRFQARFGSWHRPLDAIEVWSLEHHLLAVLDGDLLSTILEHYMMLTALVRRIDDETTERARLESLR